MYIDHIAEAFILRIFKKNFIQFQRLYKIYTLEEIIANKDIFIFAEVVFVMLIVAFLLYVFK